MSKDENMHSLILWKVSHPVTLLSNAAVFQPVFVPYCLVIMCCPSPGFGWGGGIGIGQGPSPYGICMWECLHAGSCKMGLEFKGYVLISSPAGMREADRPFQATAEPLPGALNVWELEAGIKNRVYWP